MNSIPIQGQVDAQHRLSAVVPETVPPGPVTIWMSTAHEDEAGATWMAGIAQQWIDDLSDSSQDIYTLEDGQALD
jgi:hypothetical protein